MIGLVFGAQLWAVRHFNLITVPRPPSGEGRTEFRAYPGSLNSDELAETLLARDPTLFALPAARGFTGPIWLAAAPVDHRAPVWTEPPRFLEMDPNSLGRTLSTFLHDNGFPPFDPIDKTAGSKAALGLFTPAEASENRSLLSVEGRLAARKMDDSPALPAWASAELVTNSIVRVSVNPAGTTVSAVLVERSGLAEADAAALRIAWRLRFQPEAGSRRAGRLDVTSLDWGDLVFRWAASPATNAPPGVAPRSP